MAFLANIPFHVLLWLVPVFFMLHNLEEAPFMESWSKRLPVNFYPTISTRQFVVAVSFLTLAGLMLTYASLAWLPTSIGYLLILEMQAILFFNAFIPHLVTTIRFRLYSPGFLTAVLITIPFSFYLFQRAFAQGVLTWAQFWLLLGIAPFAMVLLAFLSLQTGRILTSSGSSSS
jgi:hypothetical protein